MYLENSKEVATEYFISQIVVKVVNPRHLRVHIRVFKVFTFIITYRIGIMRLFFRRIKKNGHQLTKGTIIIWNYCR